MTRSSPTRKFPSIVLLARTGSQGFDRWACSTASRTRAPTDNRPLFSGYETRHAYPPKGKHSRAEAPSQELHLGTSSSNANCATPVKRKGKSMSRRTGQAGHTERSGKWWVVRWWMDREGQDKRVHKRARICPISGPGVLSQSERTRRAREIIAKSGADTVEYFNAVVVKKQETVTTFQEQGAWWLESLRTRKRKPVAPSTTEDWERILIKWLNPHIGTLPISEVNNASLKRLVATMSGAGLSPKTSALARIDPRLLGRNDPPGW